MQHEAGVLAQPRSATLVTVDGVVVQVQVEGLRGRELRFDATEEADELLVVLAMVALRENVALGQLQGCE
jgi:hypothetical protein